MDDLLTDDQKKAFLERRKIYNENKEFNSFWIQIQNRLKTDDDAIICIGGQRRTGKSTFGIQSCLYGFENWNPWDYMFFTIEEAIEKIRHSKPGEAYFWDEIGTDYTAYRFMSTESVSATSMLEMVGDKNLLLVFTAPSFRSFASGGRKCVTHYISVRKIGSERKAFVYKIWLDDWNNRLGRKKLRSIRFYELPIIMYETYEVFKRKYLDDYLRKAGEKVFLADKRKLLPSRVYDVFFTIYTNDGVGIRHKELDDMFPHSTVGFAVKILKSQKYIIKNRDGFHVNPDILPK